MPGTESSDTPQASRTSRRALLSASTGLAMAGGLAAGYGSFFAAAGRFLYPTARGQRGWQFVTTTADLPPGKSLEYVAPSGAVVVVARHGAGGSAEDFVALSSVCPHLGCRVHWQAVEERFFCPCHNGTFDPQGNPVSGPPAEAGQPLTRYPLKVEGGMLFIDVPLVPLLAGGHPSQAGAGGQVREA